MLADAAYIVAEEVNQRAEGVDKWDSRTLLVFGEEEMILLFHHTTGRMVICSWTHPRLGGILDGEAVALDETFENS